MAVALALGSLFFPAGQPQPGAPSAGPPEQLAADPEALAEALTPADDRPLALHTAPSDNPEGRPLLSVVLIDTGAPDRDRAALASLPFPVSIALDPLDSATPERAAAYRSAGKEVVMLATGIAEGAQASDIE